MLTIYNSNGQKKVDVPTDDNSTQVKEIQGDNVLTLSFTLYEPVVLEVNDYTLFAGERYWLMEHYRPEQKSTVEWAYSLKMYGIESLLKRFLVLNDTDGQDEAVFTLTAPPREHVQLIVKSINAGMGIGDVWKVGEVEGTDNIVIDYRGKFCHDALREVAEKAGKRAEWWFDGMTVNVVRCERGEEITLGYGKGLTSIGCDTASNVEFYTRLYPLGSTRNIDPERYGHTRLQLPGGIKHVDINVEKFGVWHKFEESAFADIYPKRIGTVSSVRNEEVEDDNGNPYTIFYFKDDGMDFNPNDYEIAHKVKRISFQEGSELAGLGNEEDGTYYFEANYNDQTKEFELITIWPYGDDTQLPNPTLAPKPGDTYILWNIRMPDEYYPLAEEEFKKAVDKYNADNAIDVSRYKAPTDHVYIEDNVVDLYIGRRVRLESSHYFPETGYRASRITKISRQVNLPSAMDIEISDALSVGTMESIAGDVDDAKNYAQQAISSLPDIIKSWENTPPTDSNLFSALRVIREIVQRALSKVNDDSAAGLITFLKGLQSNDIVKVGEFIDSLISGKGIGLFPDGRAQVSSLEVRDSLTVLRLIINEITAMSGDYNFSDAGHIKKVEALEDNTYKLWMEKRTEFDVTNFESEDVLYSIVNNLLTGGQDYYTSWFRILTKNVNDNTLTVVLYPDSDVPGGKNYPPVAGYNVTRRGNAVMPGDNEPMNERAQSWLLSSREGRIMFMQNVFKPVLEDYNYALTVGKLPNIKALEQLPVTTDDVGIVAQTIITENLYQYDYNGDIVPKRVNRGLWSLATAQSDKPYRNVQYEANRPTGTTYTLLEQHTVSHYGCTWGCLIDKTTEEPRWNSPAWVMLEGDPNYRLDFDSTNGWQFFRGQVDTVVTALVSHGNRDITEALMSTTGTEVEWLRDSGNSASDNTWKPSYVDGQKNVIHLTNADMPVGWGQSIRKVKFICRVAIPVGGDSEVIENYIGFKS